MPLEDAAQFPLGRSFPPFIYSSKSGISADSASTDNTIGLPAAIGVSPAKPWTLIEG